MDNPNDPSNPSGNGKQQRPRRPYIRRNKPKAASTENAPKQPDDPNKDKHAPRNRQNTRTENTNQNAGNRRRTNEKGQKRNTAVKDRQPYAGAHRRQSNNGRQNGDYKPEEANTHVPSVPLKAVGGIKALAENGQFGRNWWARRWIHAMEKLMDGRRLSRGQEYASQGQVLSMGEIKNGVAATVQGSRVKPYRVTIQVMPLKAEEWEKSPGCSGQSGCFPQPSYWPEKCRKTLKRHSRVPGSAFSLKDRAIL